MVDAAVGVIIGLIAVERAVQGVPELSHFVRIQQVAACGDGTVRRAGLVHVEVAGHDDIGTSQTGYVSAEALGVELAAFGGLLYFAEQLRFYVLYVLAHRHVVFLKVGDVFVEQLVGRPQVVRLQMDIE